MKYGYLTAAGSERTKLGSAQNQESQTLYDVARTAFGTRTPLLCLATIECPDAPNLMSEQRVLLWVSLSGLGQVNVCEERLPSQPYLEEEYWSPSVAN